jgi:DNA-binding NtrC family response regulator
MEGGAMGIVVKMALLFKRRSIEDSVFTLSPSQLKKRVKIVVIDDEEASFPVRGLQEDGYTIEWWPLIDAPRLRRLEMGDFDIVVLDIQDIAAPTLSDTGDGLGILRRLKNVNPDQIVVAFSGKAYDLDAMSFFKRAEDVLRKPVTLIQCKEVIDRLIGSHVSVRAYWDNLSRLLERQGVAPKRIRRLGKALASSAETGRGITLDQVKDLVGTIDSIQTVYGWVHKIMALCLLGL